MLFEAIKVILYAVVEGITEWLPISSTGHLILLQQYLPLNVKPEFFEVFKDLIQLGAILAVIVIYFNKLNPWSPHKNADERKETWSIWMKVVIATIPALLIVPLDNLIEEHIMNHIVVAIALIVYGVAFIFIEKNKNRPVLMDDLASLTFKTALFIGFAQMLAIIPGTSRSGATILAAVLLGTSRYVATEFSFFLGIPAMFGLSALKLIKYGFNYSGDELFIMLLGMIVAFAVSMIVIQNLLSYIRKNDFTVFGKYRIVLGIIVLISSFIH